MHVSAICSVSNVVKTETQAAVGLCMQSRPDVCCEFNFAMSAMQTTQKLSLLPCLSPCCITCTKSVQRVLTAAMLSVSRHSSSLCYLFSWLSVTACVFPVHVSAFSLTH